MLWLILWLLAIWAIKLILDVWWFVISWIGEILKFCLWFGFILAVLAAFDWNFLPIILVIWLPVAWIIWIIYYTKRRINPKKYISKKEKKKATLNDEDFVEIIDGI